MKFNKHDGLDENLKMHATAAGHDDDVNSDGYEGNGAYEDDEEEEVVVTMTSDDDDDLDGLEDEADELMEGSSHAEEAVIAAALPSPVAGYSPATTASKVPEKSSTRASASMPKKAVKKASGSVPSSPTTRAGRTTSGRTSVAIATTT